MIHHVINHARKYPTSPLTSAMVRTRWLSWFSLWSEPRPDPSTGALSGCGLPALFAVDAASRAQRRWCARSCIRLDAPDLQAISGRGAGLSRSAVADGSPCWANGGKSGKLVGRQGLASAVFAELGTCGHRDHRLDVNGAGRAQDKRRGRAAGIRSYWQFWRSRTSRIIAIRLRAEDGFKAIGDLGCLAHARAVENFQSSPFGAGGRSKGR